MISSVLSKPIVQPFLAWNQADSQSVQYRRKNIGSRTVGILDGFIQYDQAHYLAKLQQKYPTCEQLNKAFPSFEMEDK